MKHKITILFILLSIIAKGQYYANLDKVETGDTIRDGRAIIYGNFIQRLGFSSGGFPQEIRLMKMETKELLTFRVKPTFKSEKENAFIYFLKPGTYTILYYCWTQSKWYGGKFFTEPIYKDIDVTDDLENKIKTGQINPDDLKQFSFRVTENSLNYLGTWHFDKGMVSFSNDKIEFDNYLKVKYKRLDFSSAKLILPN